MEVKVGCWDQLQSYVEVMMEVEVQVELELEENVFSMGHHKW